jgi:hypothetical protein
MHVHVCVLSGVGCDRSNAWEVADNKHWGVLDWALY